MPFVPRINSRRITPPLLPSTSKHLSENGLHEPSQLLAKTFEEIMAECDTESLLHADYSDYSDCLDDLDSLNCLNCSVCAAKEASIVAAVQDMAKHNTRAQNLRDMPSLDSKDVGLPSDGLWDHDAAYDRRYCYKHGEYEYLLGAKDTWMRLGNFVPTNAKTEFPAKLEDDIRIRLEDLYHKTRANLEGTLSAFDPHARKCRAECGGGLLSRVYTVIGKKEHDGEMLYWIMWNPCWTPESQISDKDWLPRSLQANKNPHRRRSLRPRDDLKEQEYHHNVMQVKKLRKLY
ncbi:hypothetical protein PV08_11858 [Exophiala spinifera]|uniref:Uncharacterized protein n=1 Tax=Exophiala spinifera TaxID=91928 RepID=A0A0D2ASQ5_9EURO|nr:uncharacterized protein PV08_11858 [Exophiala spinifera]KIW09758.1 hypothetical protein PV08_11858 [Exophiala spinifera]